MIAIVQNNEIVNTGTLRSLFPNTCFPRTGPDDEWKTENNVVNVVDYIEHNKATHYLESVEPYLENNIVYSVRVVLNSDERNAEIRADKWIEQRNVRDNLLKQSDWTQLSDVNNVDKTAWATYRQQLRDITTQADPFNITWPTKPS